MFWDDAPVVGLALWAGGLVLAWLVLGVGFTLFIGRVVEWGQRVAAGGGDDDAGTVTDAEPVGFGDADAGSFALARYVAAANRHGDSGSDLGSDGDGVDRVGAVRGGGAGSGSGGGVGVGVLGAVDGADS